MWLSIAPVLDQVGVEHVEQTNPLLGRLHAHTTKSESESGVAQALCSGKYGAGDMHLCRG